MSDKTLVQHMAEIMAIVGYIQKDGVNEHFKYSYASAEKVFERVRKELSERKIAISGGVELAASEVIGPLDKQKHIVVANHTVTFTDGKDSISVGALGEGIDSGDKASMKGNTAGVKYCLAKAFLISWGDDPEADGTADGEEPNTAIASWQEKCGPACTSVKASAAWWEKNKDKIKAECGVAGASEVYKTFAVYYERLKKEAEDATA